MAAVKTSPPRSTASPASSPEATAPEQPQQPVPKRKGGRKPVYATQEERKMRNRAAQAAFRERRTEYIKHLEATIKHHEEQLSGLQQSSRNAADEVLMLRYKNSLLERILMEKGIDVAAELRAVSQFDDRPQQQPPQQLHHQPPSISQVTAAAVAAVAAVAAPVVAPTAPHPLAQQSGLPPMQPSLHRPAIGRPHAPLPKRSLMGTDPSYVKPAPEMRDGLRAIPASRNASPSVVSTMPTPPQTSFALPQQSTTRPEFPHPGISSYYPSPYQTHMEELEQEYDAELNMDDVEDDTTTQLDQQPTPDDHGDSEMTLGVAVTQPPEPRSSTAGYMFDSGFESMFASEQAPAKHDAGLSDIMRQYNQMPFSFATSNLR